MGMLGWAASQPQEWARPRRGLLDDESGAGPGSRFDDELAALLPSPQLASPASVLSGLTALAPPPPAPAADRPVKLAGSQMPSTAAGPGYRNFLERLDVPINPMSRNVLPFADDRIAANIQSFFDDAQAQGIGLKLNDGFRTNGMQAPVQGNKYGGVAPGHSHHEAGYAFDVNWKQLSDKQRSQLLDIAAKHKFKWGGNFKKPDPLHFYADPPQPLQRLIQQAQDGFWGEM